MASTQRAISGPSLRSAARAAVAAAILCLSAAGTAVGGLS